MRLVSIAVGVLLAVGTIVVPGPASAAPVPDLQVTLPELVRFNPTLTDYVVHVEGALESGVLVARGASGSVQDLAAPGDTTLQFDLEGWQYLSIEHCTLPAPSPCTVLAETNVDVRTSASYGLGDYDRTVGQQSQHRVSGYFGDFAEDEVRNDEWALVSQRSPAAAALSSGAVPGPVWDYWLPGTIANGQYWLRLTLDHTSSVFGRLTGRRYIPITVDTAAPHGSMQAKQAVAYPVHDWFRDEAILSLTGDEPMTITGHEVFDTAGRLVEREVTDMSLDPFEDYSYLPGPTERYVGEWQGRVKGRIVPGTYLFRWVGVDAAENEAVTRPVRIRVSDHVIGRVVWTRTFAAASTIVDSQVGACSSLRRPATRGWKGSVAYLSQTRCQRPGDSAVATLNAVRLPKLIAGGSQGVDYNALHISVFGGGVSGKRTDYLVANLLSAKRDRVVSRTQLDARLGSHGLGIGDPRSVIRDRGGRPYVLWQTGLTEGSRYDVRSFTVKLVYRDVAPPRK